MREEYLSDIVAKGRVLEGSIEEAIMAVKRQKGVVEELLSANGLSYEDKKHLEQIYENQEAMIRQLNQITQACEENSMFVRRMMY